VSAQLDAQGRRRGRREAGTTEAESIDLREARKRIRLLEQENEVLRRAAAYLSQANPRLGQSPK